MAEQTVELAPGESKEVSFEAVPQQAKTYLVSVNGLSGSFTAIYYQTPFEGFTATVDQLDEIEKYLTPEQYEEWIDAAYQEAATEATTINGYVAWSSDRGYYAITEEELYADPDYWTDEQFITPEEVPEHPTYVVPEGFTATVDQLDEIKDTVTQEEYDSAIDQAYEEAASEAEETGGYVAWSADEGYHTITEEELYSDPDYWW